MRRYRRQAPAAFAFLGRELRWMVLGVTTLVVLFLLISRLREDGAAARRIAQPAADEPLSPAKIAKLPQPTGPTDEDEEEAEVAKEEFQALSDGTKGMNTEEMFSYNRLVSWVKSQTFARLWAREKEPGLHLFIRRPPGPPRRLGGPRRGNPPRPGCGKKRRRRSAL